MKNLFKFFKHWFLFNENIILTYLRQQIINLWFLYLIMGPSFFIYLLYKITTYIIILNLIIVFIIKLLDL